MQNALLNLAAGRISKSPQVISEKPASMTHFLLVVVDSSELQERRFCKPLLPFTLHRARTAQDFPPKSLVSAPSPSLDLVAGRFRIVWDAPSQTRCAEQPCFGPKNVCEPFL